jgi:hypothetical protein
MNSGAEVWQGQKDDMFSDGTTDSDKSEYQVVVDLQEQGGSKAVVFAGSSAGAGMQGYGEDTFFCQPLVEVIWLGKRCLRVRSWWDMWKGWMKVVC